MRLTEFELDVMELFWAAGGELSTAEIHKSVCQSKDVAYTTVKTIVDRLEDKGAVARTSEKKGRSLVYKPMVTRESLSDSWIPPYLERFFGGSSSKLITHLISDKKLSKSELRQIKKLLEEQEKSPR